MSMYESTALHAFFSEQVHAQFGWVPHLRNDQPTLDHIVGILENFTRADELYVDNGQRMIEVADEFLSTADPVFGSARSFDEEYERRIYIGDTMLFILGILYGGLTRYHSLESFEERRLCEIGIESYYIASKFDFWECAHKVPVFEALWKNFDLIATELRPVGQKILGRRMVQ